MTVQEPTATNLDGYDAPTIAWSSVAPLLAETPTDAPDTGGPNRHTHWLATTNPDGTPHVMPVGVFHREGTLYFTSGPATRKSRNLARDPRCVVSLATHPFDLVVEGHAERVTDHTELQAIADAAVAGGWPATVEGDALTAPFSAPSAGPPPWSVYRVDAGDDLRPRHGRAVRGDALRHRAMTAGGQVRPPTHSVYRTSAT